MATWLALLMLLVLLGRGTEAVAITAPTQENLEKAVGYLRTVAYNPDLKLCREAPRVAPNVYWVASDNLLAYKALEPFDANLSATIRSELIKIAKDYNLPHSKDGVPLSLRYDVIIRDDATLEVPPRDITHMTLCNCGSYLLRYDIANGTNRFYDWPSYADLLLLVALSNHNQGDEANARSNLTLAAAMWDGVGLRDKASDNSYATYKLALLLYVSIKLGIRLPLEAQIISRIWSMQNQSSGGIFTDISHDGSPGGDTNTETTALVILAIANITVTTFTSETTRTVTQSPSSTTVTTVITKTATSGTSRTVPSPGPIPGFPLESVLVGFTLGLVVLSVLRGRKSHRQPLRQDHRSKTERVSENQGV